MNITLGLEHDSYKYVFGAYQKFAIPFDEHKTISLICGKNDRAAVQLLIYSEEEMLVGVNGEAAFYERGPIDIVRVGVKVPGLANGRVTANLIGLVEDDDRQLKSDMILGQSYLHVEKRRVQPVWIEVQIDADADPGVYHPQITVYGHRMFEDEIVLRTLSFEVNVVDVALKQPADHSFYLDLWQHNANIARKYDVALWSEQHFEILEPYVASLADLGQKAISVVVSEIPWSGQASCYDRIDPANMFEYSIVRVVRREDHSWVYDFSSLDRYVALCMKHGIREEIEVFGLLNIWVLEDAGYGRVIPEFSDAIRVRYYDASSGSYQYMREQGQLELYVAALEKHFIERGWIEKVRILADEPADLELFRSRLQTLRAMAPSFQYKVAINHAEFIKEEGLLDHVPYLGCVAVEHDQIMALKQGQSGKTLFYVACDKIHPNTFISSHLLESRVIPWLAWHFRLDGFLRWNYTVWPNDPLDRIAYHYPLFPAGDTNFVYPGRDGKPMLTLRYKLLQKGIRDYEIMNTYIEQGGSRGALAERMRSVFLWSDAQELRMDARKKADELFSLRNEDYESLIGGILEEMASGRKSTGESVLQAVEDEGGVAAE
ncbi:DUF4091 domain-containing protein [Paenibacillus methanolicus]|uniref:Uncharacterized protein DUF4091 n=1 Tax=Paenibacillus methanolicus TaxID=582686 RepID=A0A5S5CB83_9BACL|nr:DUF4091 domain-containing protein [Paenibacillus methanolicus]TYP76587.1 uncharacterized protein DUF4091 [Paenibacillus methanolicus]